MTVTKLIKSQNIDGRIYIELDNGERLKGSVMIVSEYSLYKGRELTDAEYEDVKNLASLVVAKERALKLLNSRMMSSRELVEKLVSKGETEKNAQIAAKYYESIGFIDDERYGAEIVRHYSSRSYGVGRIRQELYKRGVPKEMWDELLKNNLPEDDCALIHFIEKRLKNHEPDESVIKRLTDTLLRRGYSRSQIKNALEQYSSMEGDDV